MSELENTVDRLCSAADWESAGTISVDLLAAARRKAQAFHQQPEIPALLAVQEAVRREARSIEVKLGRQSLSVEMETPRYAWPDFKPGDFLAQRTPLVTAMEALVVQGYGKVRLEIWNRQRCWSWTVDGGRLHPGQREHSHPWHGFQLRAEGLGQSFWSQFFPSTRRANIHRALVQRLAFCPVPVELDGRTLNCPEPELCDWAAPIQPRLEAGEDARSSYRWLAEGWWAGQGLAMASPLSRPTIQCQLQSQSWQGILLNPVVAHRHHFGYAESDLGCLEEALRPEQTVGRDLLNELGPDHLPLTSRWSGKRCEQVHFLRNGASHLLDVGRFPRSAVSLSRWLGLPPSPSSAGRVLYVRDGVLLDPLVERAIPSGCVCLIADTPVHLDLTLLKPIHDQLVDQDIAWAKQHALELWRPCLGIVLHGFQSGRFGLPQSMRDAWIAAV